MMDGGWMMLVRDREKLSKVSGGVEAAAAEPHVVKMSDGACIVIAVGIRV